ncbi:dihydrofolate reductase family protein [Streptomyces sp. P9(2023)]|uniref:dihydrofolate reductase family protein n=1 Tax=Streptomyces sp. P9(2023) TaxID=3064394 RepID=UPI0028F4584D|nr:dihydrofolate reductase family protein [Streptomyces sp. P9(2023)]MDT9689040.1 dihydrofolate reductase family protein [Streptomyces sp. P9(2023)]
MTRKIVLMMGVSLDGYIEGPDRDIDWHMVDAELHQYFNDQVGAMGGILSGRVTHELMADFWPTADADPNSSPEIVEFARIWRDIPKTVYSTTLESADWNTTIVRRVDPDEVRALKEEPGGDLILGGADLAASFMEHDLIDAFHISVHPVLIGRGKPLFRETDAATPLTLTSTRTFGNGVVLLRYDRAR